MSFYDWPRRSRAILTAVPRALAPSPAKIHHRLSDFFAVFLLAGGGDLNPSSHGWQWPFLGFGLGMHLLACYWNGVGAWVQGRFSANHHLRHSPIRCLGREIFQKKNKRHLPETYGLLGFQRPALFVRSQWAPKRIKEKKSEKKIEKKYKKSLIVDNSVKMIFFSDFFFHQHMRVVE